MLCAALVAGAHRVTAWLISSTIGSAAVGAELIVTIVNRTIGGIIGMAIGVLFMSVAIRWVQSFLTSGIGGRGTD